MLTVYPRPTPWNISDTDVQALAAQCARLTKQAKRRMVLRFGKGFTISSHMENGQVLMNTETAPEMNGNWVEYGQQPTQYRALWIRVFTAVKAVAPDVAFVWSPSSGIGYPYGTMRPSAADRALLDTNDDGSISAAGKVFRSIFPT